MKQMGRKLMGLAMSLVLLAVLLPGRQRQRAYRQRARRGWI